MTSRAGTIVRKIQNAVRRLMGDDDIGAVRNAKQTPVILSTDAILDKHRHTVKPYSTNSNA